MELFNIRGLLLDRLQAFVQYRAVVFVGRIYRHIGNQVYLILRMCGLNYVDRLTPNLLASFFPVHGVKIIGGLHAGARKLFRGLDLNLLLYHREVL